MRLRANLSRGLTAAALLYLIASAGAVGAAPASAWRGFAPGEVIVRLPQGSDTHMFAVLAGLRDDPGSVDQLGDLPIYRFKIADGTPPSRKAANLTFSGMVQYAEPNYASELPEARQRSIWAVGGDTNEYVAQWAAAKIHLPEAHAVTRGEGETIALLDTGVDLTHPALAGHLTEGYDFVDLDSEPNEEGQYGIDAAYGHGTHVAGLLVLAAPEAKIMPLRTLKPGGVGTIWAQAEAIRFAAEHGADVINLSYSFGQASKLLNDVIAEVTCAAHSSAICDRNERPGIVVVAAAGNSGMRMREYPAADPVPGVLAVGASTDTDTLATFSTFGAWVRVAAPGDHILSTIPGGGYATWSGTSMATPLAAGIVALVRSANPQLRPVDAVARVTTTAPQIRADVRRRVDAAAALKIALAP